MARCARPAVIAVGLFLLFSEPLRAQPLAEAVSAQRPLAGQRLLWSNRLMLGWPAAHASSGSSAFQWVSPPFAERSSRGAAGWALSELALAPPASAPPVLSLQPVTAASPRWETPPPASDTAGSRAPNLAVPTLHATALMTVMRLSEAWLWPDPFAETRAKVILKRYREAWTRPPKWDSQRAAFEWDGDPWTINVIGHGLFGSQLYLRPRQCAHPVWGSFLFATAASTIWDYGFEASGVRPSGVDLWYTPLAGALLGEARYAGWQLAESIANPTWRQITRVLLDPLGELERALGSAC